MQVKIILSEIETKMKTNILIIGAGRSGTSTIYEYLKNHQQISFSKIKEIHFFSVDELFSRRENYYHNFFCPQKTTKYFASADTYLFIADTKIIRRIYDYNADMKFIVMLRNPVERAFSGYQYAINNGYLSPKISFIESINNEKKLLENNLSIIEQNNLCNAYQSLYFFHIKRWLSIFPKENFLFLKTKDLKQNASFVLQQISDFFELDKFISSQNIISNSAKTVKSKKLEQILLNRNLFVRQLARKLLSEKLKQKIFDSGIVDKIHKINKSDKSTKKITEQERQYAQTLFVEDLQNLNEELNIYLY